ncbi:DUF4406 domain-containing protein [Paraburkholderia phymatum]|uniref:Uncharacterized protein n=1 Tax=Paraburkholderia phymatum (strain DSM 17167 / CIP 108236 / LMG 21445 / STM815) TaxID=391038 RepID=B2JLA0_PARP8|nr:DUF4406 domain-containing protein [Paraburkholderia phymatum]ACC74068.1 hypothetical protein Bphy_4978 [Paraburkholderia phymatum STM815]
MENSRQSVALNDDQLLQAIACVVDGKTATYVSGPITTGQHFINWYVHAGFRLGHGSEAYLEALRRDVVAVNQKMIAEVTRQTRGTGRLVIEPATLEVNGWGQTDYVSFWLKVIDTFASEMVMVPQWQYSLGCCAEFRHAIDGGLTVKDHRGEHIDRATGMNMLLDAAKDIEARGRDFEFLIKLAARLSRFADQH